MYLNRITFNQFDQGENRGMQILHVNRQYPLNIRYNGRTVRAVNYRGLGKVWRLPARTSENYEFQRLLPPGTSYDEMEGVYKKNGKEVNEKSNGVIYGGKVFRLWRPQGLNEQQLIAKYGSIAVLKDIQISYLSNNGQSIHSSRYYPDNKDIGFIVKMPKPNHLYKIVGPEVSVFIRSRRYQTKVSEFFRKSGPNGHVFYAGRSDQLPNYDFEFKVIDTVDQSQVTVKVQRNSTPSELDGSHGLTINHLDFFRYNSDGQRNRIYISGSSHITNGISPDDDVEGDFDEGFIGGGNFESNRYDSGNGNSH